jgi:hypothetical protein
MLEKVKRQARACLDQGSVRLWGASEENISFKPPAVLEMRGVGEMGRDLGK